MVNGNVVIPAGSPTTDEVTQICNKAMKGKSSRISGRALYVRANGPQIRTSQQMDDEGL